MFGWNTDQLKVDKISQILGFEGYCNVPDPPTNEEDATMASTIRATSPMNMCIDKMLKQYALK